MSTDGKLVPVHNNNTMGDYQSNQRPSNGTQPASEIGSAVDYLKKLCDQSFFGRY
jgi:hypothetical protein